MPNTVGAHVEEKKASIPPPPPRPAVYFYLRAAKLEREPWGQTELLQGRSLPSFTAAAEVR